VRSAHRSRSAKAILASTSMHRVGWITDPSWKDPLLDDLELLEQHRPVEFGCASSTVKPGNQIPIGACASAVKAWRSRTETKSCRFEARSEPTRQAAAVKGFPPSAALLETRRGELPQSERRAAARAVGEKKIAALRDRS